MPRALQNLLKDLRSLATHPAGNVSILSAIAAIPLLVAAGVAIDYSRATRVQSRLQAAVDSAALAAATVETTDPKKRKAAGATYFESNVVDSELQDVQPIVTVGEDTISVRASYEYATSFMGLAGIRIMEIGGFAEVELSKDSNGELALVLDYSGSMKQNNKYIRMRDAAIKMIDNIKSEKGATLKIGLAPFSAMVLSTMDANYVSQASVGPMWTGCTQDRNYPWNLGVDTPNGTAPSKWGYIDAGSENTAPNDCAAYTAKNLGVMALTADTAAVKAQLDVMVPLGNTNIPLGVEFGWNLLDPAAPFTEGAPYADENTEKFLVLLTDGVQTSKQWDKKDKRSVKNGEDNLEELCSNMEKKDIMIFAIAYDITDKKVTKLLQKCAGSNYFEATVGGSELEAVFSAIAERVKKSMLHLTR